MKRFPLIRRLYVSQPALASTSHGGSSARQVDLEPLLEWVDLAPDCVGADRIEGVLLGLAQVAAQVVAGAEAASLTLVGADGRLSTPEFTAALAQQMDAAQYDADQGPCVDAASATERTALLVSDLADQARWPALASQSPAPGARSCCR